MEPKRPGRKPGAAYGQRAARPVPPHVDETLEAVLPEQCERCGGAIEAEAVIPQYQTDIPPVRPVVTRFNVHVGRCRSCGRRVQGRHPRQTSAALGAAANLIGPNALALAAHLQKTGGLSHDKIASTRFARIEDSRRRPRSWARGIAVSWVTTVGRRMTVSRQPATKPAWRICSAAANCSF